MWKFDFLLYVWLFFDILRLHEIMIRCDVRVQWFRPRILCCYCVNFVYMYMKYLLSPSTVQQEMLLNYLSHYEYNYTYLANVFTCNKMKTFNIWLLIFAIYSKGAWREISSQTNQMLFWSFVPHISTQNRDDHVCKSKF